MENSIKLALDVLFGQIRVSPEDLTGLSDFTIIELKALAVHFQEFQTATLLRDEEMRRIRLRQNNVG